MGKKEVGHRWSQLVEGGHEIIRQIDRLTADFQLLRNIGRFRFAGNRTKAYPAFLTRAGHFAYWSPTFPSWRGPNGQTETCVSLLPCQYERPEH